CSILSNTYRSRQWMKVGLGVCSGGLAGDMGSTDHGGVDDDYNPVAASLAAVVRSWR
ncbi:hypothetical protein Dimus_016242, partial [Dionaea muscipula]